MNFDQTRLAETVATADVQRDDARRYVCRAWPGMTVDAARTILAALGLDDE